MIVFKLWPINLCLYKDRIKFISMLMRYCFLVIFLRTVKAFLHAQNHLSIKYNFLDRRFESNSNHYAYQETPTHICYASCSTWTFARGRWSLAWPLFKPDIRQDFAKMKRDPPTQKIQSNLFIVVRFIVEKMTLRWCHLCCFVPRSRFVGCKYICKYFIV